MASVFSCALRDTHTQQYIVYTYGRLKVYLTVGRSYYIDNIYDAVARVLSATLRVVLHSTAPLPHAGGRYIHNIGCLPVSDKGVTTQGCFLGYCATLYITGGMTMIDV